MMIRRSVQPSSFMGEVRGGRLPLALTPESVTIGGRRGDRVTGTLTVDEMLTVDDEGVTRSSRPRGLPGGLAKEPRRRDRLVTVRLQVACALCGERVEDGPVDPCASIVVNRWRAPEEQQEEQQFFTHAACLLSVLRPDALAHAPVLAP